MSSSEAEGMMAKWPDSKELAQAEANIIATLADQYIVTLNKRIQGVRGDQLRHEATINARALTRLHILGLDLAAAEFRQQGFEATVDKVECEGDTIYALGIVSTAEIGLD